MLLMFLTKLKKQLLGIGTTGGIETIIASTARTFNQRLRGLGVAKQILLHITANLFVVGLHKEGAIHVINVLCNGLHAYTTFTSLSEYLQYLLVVGQRSEE